MPLILALMLMLGVLSPNARPDGTPLAPELKGLGTPAFNHAEAIRAWSLFGLTHWKEPARHTGELSAFADRSQEQ